MAQRVSGRNDPSTTPGEDRYNLLARVASMYYEEGLTQQEISARLGYSRSAISRLLSEARKVGIVEIRVYHQLVRNAEMERELQARFDLREVRVLATGGALPYAKMLRRLGELAAWLVEQAVKRDSVLGVSWGTSIYEVAHALRPPHYPDVMVVQLIGALGTPDPQIDGPELARWFAQLYGCRYLTLPAPLVVDSPAVRDALLNDRRVGEVLKRASEADVAVVGIGSVDPSVSSLVRAGYLTPDELGELAAGGVVGDVCSIMFDAQGRLVDMPITRRMVSIQPAVLRRIPLVLGVAGGAVKARPILGALRSGLVNALVTDEEAARLVLEMDSESLGIEQIAAAATTDLST